MPTVVISPFNVVNFPEGGGHFWVYMQYAQGLRQLGCEVFWLEGFHAHHEPRVPEAAFSFLSEPNGFNRTLQAARVYVQFRWLGDSPEKALREKTLWRYGHLHDAAKQLGLV